MNHGDELKNLLIDHLSEYRDTPNCIKRTLLLPFVFKTQICDKEMIKKVRLMTRAKREEFLTTISKEIGYTPRDCLCQITRYVINLTWGEGNYSTDRRLQRFGTKCIGESELNNNEYAAKPTLHFASALTHSDNKQVCGSISFRKRLSTTLIRENEGNN